MIRTSLLVMCLIFNCVVVHAASASRLYELAQKQYDLEDYETAVELMKMATDLEPNNSKFYHLLGKSYGRIAEQSNLLKAMEFSKKTLKSLEKAVELDDSNFSAMSDLAKYYRAAPVFLGGDLKKANHLQNKVDAHESNSTDAD